MMSRSNVFRIDSHEIDGQHIREYQRATSGAQETVLRLAVKQYTPLDNLNPGDNDITIVGAHANGFPKELYEPLWEEIYLQLKHRGLKIRGIWIADVANQGRSGILNEKLLGNDPSWFDHSRDLLHMINHFRAKIKIPLVGIGHSMGGCQLAQLALMHPRLLSTLILIDPVIQAHDSAPYGPSPAALSTFRRDIWTSREAAESAFANGAMYKSWHPAVLKRWKDFGLRELPTALYPSIGAVEAVADSKEYPVTLATTKHQEVFTFLRPDYNSRLSPDEIRIVDRIHAPDRNPQILDTKEVSGQRRAPNLSTFYRPEPVITLHNLPFLRPIVLYIFGGDSPMSLPEAQDEKMATTGTGVGGSGGQLEGKVKKVVLPKIGHLVPFEVPEEAARHCADFLQVEIQSTLRQMSIIDEQWGRLENRDKMVVDDAWIQHMQKAKRQWLEKL